MLANLKGGISRAHRADAWGHYADDLLHLITCRMGLLVIKHPAEIAHVEAAAAGFREIAGVGVTPTR